MITREKFRQYLIVQKSAVVNMTASTAVADLSEDLEEDEVREIRRTYATLTDTYIFKEAEWARIAEEAGQLRQAYQ